jgi:hypothetical protein
MANRKYTLLSGVNLQDASQFKLEDSTKGTLSVENGNLILTAHPYFYITIR